MPIRILTLLLGACFTLLVVKLAEFWNYPESAQKQAEVLIATPGFAEEKKEEEKEEEKKEEKKDEKKEEKKDEKNAKEEDKEKEGEEGEKKEGEKEGEDSKAPPKQMEQPKYTETEVEILQRLSDRRKELEEWQRELELRENVLAITQNKINQKLEELRVLKGEVEVVLAEYNKKDDEKIMSLVKIYEKMKPKPAAEIFSQLDMPTMVKVVRKMKEAQVAAIMGQMDPKRARELTQVFAKMNSLQGNAAAAAAVTASGAPLPATP